MEITFTEMPTHRDSYGVIHTYMAENTPFGQYRVFEFDGTQNPSAANPAMKMSFSIEFRRNAGTRGHSLFRCNSLERAADLIQTHQLFVEEQEAMEERIRREYASLREDSDIEVLTVFVAQ